MASFVMSGCTVRLTPEKFDAYPQTLQPVSVDTPINVVGAKTKGGMREVKTYTGEERLVTVLTDFNKINDLAVELIKAELTRNDIPVSDNAERVIRFTATKVQWEDWAGGFAMGIYIDFDIETTDGYKAKYTVKDGSGVSMGRALGGAITRAAEQTLKDKHILNYIQQGTTHGSTHSLEHRLKQLKSMRQKELISEEEYQKKKQEILDSL